MTLKEVITIAVTIILIVIIVSGKIISSMYENYEEPFRSKIILMSVMTTTWIIFIFICCVYKGWMTGKFDGKSKLEPETESVISVFDRKK
jgi:hypothetical protein